MNNTKLAMIAALLGLVSVFSYVQSVNRAERFERGQKFLSQLNPDSIHEIEVTKGGETVSLKRGTDQFVVANHHNYPAKNEAVNSFLNDVLKIGLEKVVGKGDSLEKELDIGVESESRVQVLLKDNNGKDMVSFAVGKTQEGGNGHYIKRLDGDDAAVYLTDGGVYLTDNADGFLDKDIVDIPAADIVAINGPSFAFATVDGVLQLQDIPAKKQEKSSESSQVKNLLSGLSSEKIYLADDPQVAGLGFSNPITVQLNDQSGYEVTRAEKDGKHFIKIRGTFQVSEIGVSRDETEEELKEKSEIMSRSNEINTFNNFHGSWVYEISEFAAGKFKKTKQELIEDIPTES